MKAELTRKQESAQKILTKLGVVPALPAPAKPPARKTPALNRDDP
jgi:hypothetical protein